MTAPIRCITTAAPLAPLDRAANEPGASATGHSDSPPHENHPVPTTPQPIPTTSTTRLPCGVTSFLTHAQRARVLARLARHGPDRAAAPLAALGLETPAADTTDRHANTPIRTATVRERHSD